MIELSSLLTAAFLAPLASPPFAGELVPVVDERLDPPGVAAGLADPFVLWDGDAYYLFGTGARCVRTRTLRADDAEALPLELDLGAERARGAYQVWSFRVYRHTDGSFHGYGTLHYGRFRTVIGHFIPTEGRDWTPGHPLIHWRLDRTLIGDLASGRVAYDSNLVTDEDGRLWLVYNAGHPREALGVDIHIKAQRMTDPSTLDIAEPPRILLSPQGLRSEDRNPGSIQIVEGTHLCRLGGMWALVYSVGDFDDGNYKIGIAYSERIVPPAGSPYRKVLVPDPSDVWGNGRPGEEVLYLLQTQHRDWPHFVGDRLNGPGIGNILRLADGRYWLLFHARKRGLTRLHGQGRYVWRIPLDANVAADTAAQTWVRPRLGGAGS